MDFVDLAALTIHDVKNRLTLLAHRAESRGDAETLRGVMESAGALTRLLAFYKAEKGALSSQVDARVPADMVEELALEMTRQTTLTVDADLESAPALGFYDENLIRMVLLDALYNAIRHARSRVLIGAGEADGWLVFFVRDDGPGYPDALLADSAAMQPLSREGTGIGLTLAARVAALHVNGDKAGNVVLANEGGAVFRLRLPA